MQQRLDLWSGTIRSSFTYAGRPVSVTTAAHPERAMVAFRIESPLLRPGRLEVRLAFPYASDDFMGTADWGAADRHQTTVERHTTGGARIVRTLDATTYTVDLSWNDAALHRTGDPHVVRVSSDADVLDLVVSYADGEAEPLAGTAEATFAAAATWWDAVLVPRCGDRPQRRSGPVGRRARAPDRPLTVPDRGQLLGPPAAAGDRLSSNSWQGKFHLEMHWWHAAHFVLVGPARAARPQPRLVPVDPPAGARDARAHQGYEGARWPKQVGPDGRESPNEIGPFLVWQQPHLLCLRRAAPPPRSDAELVGGLAELVEETARFMASFVEERRRHFHLAAPAVPAQESLRPAHDGGPDLRARLLVVGPRGRRSAGGSGRASEHDERWTHVQAHLALPAPARGRYRRSPPSRSSSGRTTRRCSARSASCRRPRSSTRR